MWLAIHPRCNRQEAEPPLLADSRRITAQMGEEAVSGGLLVLASLEKGSSMNAPPKLTEARTLTDMCGASRVDASDLLLIEDSDDDIDFTIGADDPEERYPDGEFEEWDEEEGCSD